MIDFNILIFDILEGKKLKKYSILEEEENNLYKSKILKLKNGIILMMMNL